MNGYFKFLLPIVALAVVPIASAQAEEIVFEIPLSGEQQVPPVPSEGSGLLVAVYDTETRILAWTVTYNDLSGPPSAAHFHKAVLGENGPVVLDFGAEGLFPGPIVGERRLTEDEIDDLFAGLWYLNVHTAQNPGGEIRGQLVLPE